MGQERIYVQYGCGMDAPPGWINFDGSPRLRIEKSFLFGSALGFCNKKIFPDNVLFGDIVKGLPIGDGVADYVYASHVLEHLSFSDALIAVKNTHRILKRGGLFRLIVPCLQVRINWYIRHRGKQEENAANSFMKLCCFGGETRPKNLMERVRHNFGNSNHLWMYDEETMFDLLKQGGFTDLGRFQFGDAEDEILRSVENPDRFYFGDEVELAVQARKP